MANFADLIQRISTDVNRPDLLDISIDYAQDAIRHFQRSFFYDTPLTVEMPTEVGVSTYDTPDTMVSVTWIRLSQSGVWRWLRKVRYEEILGVDSLVVPTQSVPSMWAPYGQGFRIYSNPNLIYTLELTGNGFIPIPPLDETAEGNFWTDDAEQLIRYTTLAKLYRIRIGNYDRAAQLDREAEGFRKQLWKQTFSSAATRVIAGHW